MRTQNKRAAQAVAVVKHHFIVMAAETGGVRLGAHVVFHIGSAAAEREADRMLFQVPLDIAERTLVVCFHGIHQGDCVNGFFHGRTSVVFI